MTMCLKAKEPDPAHPSGGRCHQTTPMGKIFTLFRFWEPELALMVPHNSSFGDGLRRGEIPKWLGEEQAGIAARGDDLSNPGTALL